MISENREQLIIQKTCDLLSLHGECHVVYITAELAPFSNQFKPDLVYIPGAYNTSIIYFIEYKQSPQKEYSKKFISALKENKLFAEESLQKQIVYIFSTNNKLKVNLRTIAKRENIIILDRIEDEKDLYIAIINLTK